MDNRIQRHLDEIIKTPIPSKQFVRAMQSEWRAAQKMSEKLDGQGQFHLAEQYSTAAEQLETVADTITRIARTTSITIRGILDREIPPVLDYLSQRNATLVDDLTDTIGLAAIDAYLNQNREAVKELIPILCSRKELADSEKIDQEEKNWLKWELRDIMKEESWDEKIQEWLLSTIDSSKKLPPMSPGHSRKE